MNFDLFLHTNPKLSASFTSFYLRNPKQFKVTWINNGIKAEGLSVYILFSSVVSDSLWPYGLQHARPLCTSPTPEVCSNSCPLSWWCHLTSSSSVIPFSSCLQSFSASGSFPMSQFFTSVGQRFGVSASVLPMNIQDWSPLGLTGWISPNQSQGTSIIFSNIKFRSINSSALNFFIVQLSHPYTTTGKTTDLTR